MSKIYQFKITLKDIRPPIWRRVLVSSDITLQGMSDIIIRAMGWENSHLSSFEILGLSFFIHRESALELGGLLMSEYRLSELFLEEKKKARYIYDFGDYWDHEVVLEKILEPEAGSKHKARCIAGKRNCPPEDCGGPWGYAELLEALADPKHPDHKELKRWLGKKFDPEAFDLEKINKRLK
jgi:hypothetical protein